jgi:hypothetical protein
MQFLAPRFQHEDYGANPASCRGICWPGVPHQNWGGKVEGRSDREGNLADLMDHHGEDRMSEKRPEKSQQHHAVEAAFRDVLGKGYRYSWPRGDVLEVGWRGFNGWRISLTLPEGSGRGHIRCELQIGRGDHLDLWGLLQQPGHPGLCRLLETLGPLAGADCIPKYKPPEPGTLRQQVEKWLDQLGEHHEYYDDEDGRHLWVLAERWHEGEPEEIMELLIHDEEVRLNLTAAMDGDEAGIHTLELLSLNELTPESLRELIERGRQQARRLLGGAS